MPVTPTAVDVCLFDAGDREGASERRVPLTERAHGFWFGLVRGVAPGQRYAVRVAGPWQPENGLRHNPAKLLLDPYARAIEGDVRLGPPVYGHQVDVDAGAATASCATTATPRPRAALRRRRRGVRLGGRRLAAPVPAPRR